MDCIIATQTLALAYLRQQSEIQQFLEHAALESLREAAVGGGYSSRWAIRPRVHDANHMLIARLRQTEVVTAVLVGAERAVDQDKVLILDTVGPHSSDPHRGEVLQRMMAVVLLRSLGMESLPAALAVWTTDLDLWRALQGMAKRLTEAHLYPGEGNVVSLQGAGFSRRLADVLGYRNGFGAAEAAWGDTTARTAPQPVLAVLDLRACSEARLEAEARWLYRRRLRVR